VLIALITNFIIEASLILGIDFVPGFNIMVKRTIFEKVGGFNEKVLHAEDHHFAKTMHAAGYRLTFVKEPIIIFSLRRFRHEGTLQVLRKYARATLHILFIGPITKELFTYEMGGKGYTIKEQMGKPGKSIAIWRKWLEEYLKEFTQLQ
jgi:GT2 family glycosyltransferase